MLSINIPIYNYFVDELVTQLIGQAEKLSIPYEINLFDDGSRTEFIETNRKISQNKNVNYEVMSHNLGRAAIRNKMGLASQYRYLLFIDADSLLINDNYLKCYLDKATDDLVLCGGTQYADQPPKEQEKMLRWLYGQKREAISAAKRGKKGFVITSNNFLIGKKLFEETLFREDLKKYGHEDTLLGYDLYKSGVEIKHIENPVEHIGLESAEVFIDKTERGLQNLKYIYETLLDCDEDFKNHINFLYQYNKLTHYLSPKIIAKLFNVSKNRIYKKLISKQPNLTLFNAYKVGYYANL